MIRRERYSRRRKTLIGLLRRQSAVVGHGGANVFPWRQNPTPCGVLVAEVLLQRTPSDRVVPVFQEVVRAWPDFRQLARASPAKLENVLEPLGLQRRRAAALIDGARLVEARWVGLLPRSPSELEQFPGVGRYTAGATAVVVSGVASGFVDAGMARLLRRYFGLASMSSASEKRPSRQRCRVPNPVKRLNVVQRPKTLFESQRSMTSRS